MNPFLATLIAFLVLLSPALSPAVDELSYGGSNTIAISILFDGALKVFEQKRGVAFDRFELKGGTNAGLKNLLEGKVTVVGSSRRLTPQEKEAGLVESVIGRDVNSLWVNTENPVTGVTSEQAASLLDGKIRNWKEIGGKDEPVELVLAPEGSFSNCQETIRQILLKDEPLKKADVLVGPPRDRLAEVTLRKGGLSLISQPGAAALLEPGIRNEVKPLAIDGIDPTKENVISGKYRLIRPLVLVTRGEPQGKVKQFIDFMLSPEGQSIVAREAIPVR